MSQTAEQKQEVALPAPKYGFEESWLDRTPRWLSLLVLGVAGILVWYGITLLERRLVFWRKSDPLEISSA